MPMQSVGKGLITYHTNHYQTTRAPHAQLPMQSVGKGLITYHTNHYYRTINSTIIEPPITPTIIGLLELHMPMQSVGPGLLKAATTLPVPFVTVWLVRAGQRNLKSAEITSIEKIKTLS